MRYYLLLIVCFLYGCGDSYFRSNGYPLGITVHKFRDGGMTYFSYHNSFGAIEIRNMSLDSIQYLYYKQQLNKK